MEVKHAITNPSALTHAKADRALEGAATFWFLVTLIGQWIFVYYIAAVYGGTAVQGNFEVWGEHTLKGYIEGDLSGNLIFGAHVLMAAIISFGGTLQLIPQIRARASRFHRWNGRLFIFTGFAMALGGLYLIWIRDSTTSPVGSIGISLNSILLMVFATLAIRTARAGDFDTHRRWALRTFMMVSGVWFFRIGLMAWIIINQGPVGVTDNLDGPFDMFWAFANYLLPLAVLEFYFRTQDRAGNRGKFTMAAVLIVVTLVMVVGIFGASMFMWFPGE